MNVTHGQVTRCDFTLRKKLNGTSTTNKNADDLKQKIEKMMNATKKPEHHYMRYSTIVLFFVGSLIALIYYGNRTATRKLHLRRGFHQLFNKANEDDGSLTPLDSEMTSNKIEIVTPTSRQISQTDFSTNAKCSNDEIVLLDKS